MMELKENEIEDYNDNMILFKLDIKNTKLNLLKIGG